MVVLINRKQRHLCNDGIIYLTCFVTCPRTMIQPRNNLYKTLNCYKLIIYTHILLQNIHEKKILYQKNYYVIILFLMLVCPVNIYRIHLC